MGFRVNYTQAKDLWVLRHIILNNKLQWKR